MNDRQLFEVAEEYARRALVERGFDASLTGSGADGGLDIVDSAAGLAAQVKLTQSPVGAPVLQQLIGAGIARGASVFVCFSLAGYSAPATEYALECDVALFKLDFRGVATPLNQRAIDLRPDRDRMDIDWAEPYVPGKVSSACRAARQLQLDGQSSLAEATYRTAAEYDDGYAAHCLAVISETRALAGPSNSRQEDLIEARDWYQRAIDLGETAGVFEGLGSVCERLGALEDAEHAYRQGVALGDSACRSNLAGLLLKRAESRAEEGSVDQLEQLAADGSAEAALNLARHQVANGSTEQLERLAASGLAEAMITLARVLDDNGDIEAAQAWARRAANEGHVAAMLALARFYVDEGNTAEALTYFERAARRTLGSAGAEVFAELAELQSACGREQDASTWLIEGAFRGNDAAIDALGRLEGSSRLLNNLHQAKDGDLEALEWLADYFEGRQMIDGVNRWRLKAEFCRRTDHLDCIEHPDPVVNESMLEYRTRLFDSSVLPQGGDECSRQLMRRLRRELPKRSYSPRYRAWADAVSGGRSEAEAELRRQAEEGIRGSMFALAMLLRESGREDEADAWRERARAAPRR